MNLISWNVNGIRACLKKGFLQWFEEVSADIVCLQETKVKKEQLEKDFPELIHPNKYHSFWHSAEKAGYSSVSIYSKKEPIDVIVGLGNPIYDCEGRVLTLDMGEFVLINAYFPNSQREGKRLDYKLGFCSEIKSFCDQWVKKGKHVVLCGDYNIAHQEIDLKNPKTNHKNAGFLPEERAWMTHFLEDGYSDVFRERVKEPDHYTWWSYRPGIRERNIGWRIDYHCVNKAFGERVESVNHFPEVMGSDHCPVSLTLKK
ncbi:MAG: exodeoxyribonuclease III [Bdellovibrionaceae bacterium]|nr:exodeoxyribonuclease III [Pseudobdellovibrionaceae bacterium]|tara:strand:+ start:1702 stop:2475 length:774 start_codon:yes stop_codon:yes gene_type:complete